ncbi:type IIL restriction-modification enzyme MmeI, partial [Rhodopseudomonas sp. B29]|uniref:type IIL restriction-modification enzyme MmeI n=1 Tax=Rhodopseudomonas sp. B29 TaxID=95607 RepID=UPI0035E3D981
TTSKNAYVLFPYLIANDFLGRKDGKPTRYVIDFKDLDVLGAGAYPDLFERVKATVLPARTAAAKKEAKRNKPLLDENPKAKVNVHHANFLKRWWCLSYRRTELMDLIATLPRYIVCGRVTKRPIFEFVSSDIHPSDALSVFPLQDDYSFGILSSEAHWAWFTERCSTLTERYRYTSNTVFDSFPWPQAPQLDAVKAVAAAARKLRQVRRGLCEKHDLSLRELYRSAELPGNHPLDEAQAALDSAVRKAYGMTARADPLKFLFDLNQSLTTMEEQGEPIVGPGLLPAFAADKSLLSDDCLRMP